jgi:two-component system cell cycle sensor histidine kinase/response regulator CckA
MEQLIHILHLEDDPADAELVQARIEEAGLTYQITRVQARAEFDQALRQGGYDIILADFRLPMYDGMSALRLAQEVCPDIPFIFVSGTMGEDAAIEGLTEGATDYVLKQKLSRLAPAIKRALHDAENRRERQRAEATQAKLEDQLRQAQKMESIGRLAGGVAHDLNNLLTVIRGYTDLLQAKIPAGDPQIEDLGQIRRASERATTLIRQLLAFSRQQILVPTVLDLNELVTNLNKMLGRLISEDITFTTVLQPGLWSIIADPGQIEQVIMNLVVNARDAMPTGGQLTIETSNVQFDDSYAKTHLEVPTGPCVMLTVTDTGHGMDKPTQARIFEPFFTTKEVGKGTGLGLATVYGIVKQSGGDILVYSEPGQGATFKIYLPANETTFKDFDVSPTPPVSRRGSETILLVEDEEMVRDLVRLALQNEGYTILEARHGSEALSLSGQHQGPIDMLMTDVIMPQMSGRELAERLTVLRPQMKMLFMSGYTDDAVVRHGLLTAEVEFLPKPFSLHSLASKVREVLDK